MGSVGGGIYSIWHNTWHLESELKGGPQQGAHEPGVEFIGQMNFLLKKDFSGWIYNLHAWRGLREPLGWYSLRRQAVRAILWKWLGQTRCPFGALRHESCWPGPMETRVPRSHLVHASPPHPSPGSPHPPYYLTLPRTLAARATLRKSQRVSLKYFIHYPPISIEIMLQLQK